MLDKIKDFLKKTPKGYIALPVAVVAVILATVIAIPFFGSDSNSGDNKDNVISFHDKEDDDEDEDLEQDASNDNKDNNSDGSTGESDDNTGDDATDEGSSESGDDAQSGNGDSNSDANNGGSTGSNNSGTSSGTSSNEGSNPSGDTGSSNNSGSSSAGNTGSTDLNVPGISLSEIPAYSGTHYIILNNNVPHFSTSNLSSEAFEYYSDLDSLGRCGVAYACLGKETMPADDEERGSISSVKPTGWIQKKYSVIKTQDLYNRSHLIAWSLSAENANKQNLITGTPQLNQDNMTIFEDMVYDYLHECIDNNVNAHVMYRVTPFFEGNNLVASGVQMEAWSIEDNGESICFNVFIYNAQDGVTIDYATGESWLTDGSSEDDSEDETTNSGSTDGEYVVHAKKGKIHKATCSSLPAEQNRVYCSTLDEAIAKSKEITGGEPDYAGCCMSGYGYNHDGNVLPCHIENRNFMTTQVLAIVTNTKQHLLAA